MSIQDPVIRVRLKEALDRHAQRSGRRLTYGELASLAGIAPATVESLATRRGYNATLKTLARLCVALRCSPAELLELEAPARRRGAMEAG